MKLQVCDLAPLSFLTSSDTYLELCETSMRKLFCKNSWLLRAVNYFRKKSCITDVWQGSKYVFAATFWHFVKSVQIRSFSGPYFPVFGLNTEITFAVFSFAAWVTDFSEIQEAFLLFWNCLILGEINTGGRVVIIIIVSFIHRKN